MLPLLAEPMVSLPASRLPSSPRAFTSAVPRSLRVTSRSGLAHAGDGNEILAGSQDIFSPMA